MKIAIVGAHGVGKTTLTKVVEQETNLAAPIPTPMHNPAPGETKSLQECSNAEVLRLSQRRYTERIVQEHSRPDIVSDGSVLHEWVYAATKLRLGIFPDHTTSDARDSAAQTYLALVREFTAEALAYTQDTYDAIFFIPIEFSLPRENPPISDRFQTEASETLHEALSTLSKPVHLLSGSPQTRIRQLLVALG